jgi:uncharacterized protein
MIYHGLDSLLGTTTKVRVLRALMQLDSPVSGGEAKRLAGVRSADALWTALDELSVLGILTREQTRGSHLYRINREHDFAAPLATLFAVETAHVIRLRDRLHDCLAKAGMKEEVHSVILYGSNARGEATASSDVDLLVLVEDENAVAAVRDALIASVPAFETQMGLTLSPYVLARGRVEARYREGDPLMQTIVDEGRALLGEPLREVVGAW